MKGSRPILPQSVQNSLREIMIERKIENSRNRWGEALIVLDNYAKIGKDLVRERKNEKIF